MYLINKLHIKNFLIDKKSEDILTCLKEKYE